MGVRSIWQLSLGIAIGSLCAVYLNSSHGGDASSSFSVTEPQRSPPTFSTRILSYNPLIIHLEHFLPERERKHLINLAESLFQASLVEQKASSEPNSYRTSSTAILPRADSVVGQVIDRAAEFQGFESSRQIENLQATRYTEGQEFRAHRDWRTSLSNGLADRTSTFFAILDANCSDCGTVFPYLKYNWEDEDDRICQYVECGKESMEIKAVAGNAVFWRNVHPDGTGHNLTVHAGLPVSSGRKIGLNIWTTSREWS